jgi:uncharacterized protein (TIGR04255 family)
MHYKKNFLTKTILRFDFGAVPALKGAEKSEFSARIEDIYPLVTPKPTTTVSLNFGPKGSAIQHEVTAMLWEHRKVQDGTRVVFLSSDFLAIEFGPNDYDHFPPFRAEMEKVFGAFQAVYQPTHINRLGLRYINEITLPQGNPLEWTGLVKAELITSVKACFTNGAKMVRSVHQLQMQREDLAMRFVYGISNPDHPAALARRHFMLDYDCYQQESIPSNEVMSTLDRLNGFCETMFEASIDGGLRQLMEVINE